MPSLIVTDRDGATHEIEAQEGNSLMELIRDAGLPIEAACGGCAACATCHIYVDSDWVEASGSPDEEEEDMLDLALAVQDNSRLACQVAFVEALDGIRVTLAPE